VSVTKSNGTSCVHFTTGLRYTRTDPAISPSSIDHVALRDERGVHLFALETPTPCARKANASS
jgi:hypothetical protein